MDRDAHWLPGDGERGLASVVIPTYNRASLLTRAVRSVLGQTHRPLEVVVVDDGSDDETPQILEGLAREAAAQSVRFEHRRTDRAGAPAARNVGARSSRGEFLQFLDSDDELLPKKISRCVAMLEEPHLAFCSTDYVERDVERADSDTRTYLRRRSSDPADHLLHNKLNTPAPLYRRSALAEVGPWDESLDIWQDTDFTLRVLLAGLEGAWIEEPLVVVHATRDSIMRQDLERVWPAMVRSIAAMERRAEDAGRLDARFRAAAGRRLAAISRRLARAGLASASRAVHRAAMGRMPSRLRWKYKAHRWAQAILGPERMARLGWG